MSKSYDKVNGEKVREQYFRSDRRKSKVKKGLELGEKVHPYHSYSWKKRYNLLFLGREDNA